MGQDDDKHGVHCTYFRRRRGHLGREQGRGARLGLNMEQVIWSCGVAELAGGRLGGKRSHKKRDEK